MKKGGMILLLCITVAFICFIFGVLVGRHIPGEPVVIQEQVSKQDVEATLTTESQHADKYLININTASAEMLDTLPGIGPVLAQRIVEYRNTHGPFADVSDLLSVEGIGSEKFLKIYPLITAGG